MQLKNPLNNHCWKLWHATVITWDGMVVPCCFDKDAQHRLGDLKDRPFREIWRSEDYVNFRRLVLNSRKNVDICANCSEGTKGLGINCNLQIIMPLSASIRHRLAFQHLTVFELSDVVDPSR
jgi:radical SAM protein with 4Fe4S-binding SPASM domain